MPKTEPKIAQQNSQQAKPKTRFLANFLKKAKNWLLKFLQIQLIMSLMSLVVLINWGLPLSLLSPIGNMMFSPIFTVFLGLSSVIFFLEILHIPNAILVYLLEKTTSLWFFLAQDFNNQSLVGFAKPSIVFSIIIPIIILFILTYKKINSLNKSIIALTLLFCASCAYLKLAYTPNNFIKQIPCNKGQVTFIYDNGKTAIIDPGYIGQRLSAPSWVQYTLAQEIIKSCGSMTIDHLIVLQPGKITFDAIKQLSKSVVIKNIDLIVFDGKMKGSMASSFFRLKDEAKKRGIAINRIGRQASVINLNENTKIFITPVTTTKIINIITPLITPVSQNHNIAKNIKCAKLTYPAICVTCDTNCGTNCKTNYKTNCDKNCDTKTIDNAKLKIYSAKWEVSKKNIYKLLKLTQARSKKIFENTNPSPGLPFEAP